MDNRFQRLKLLIGEENFYKLTSATVAVFGVGGVGSFAVEALARSGVGHLVLIDKDDIDETNINRQIHALTSTVGKSKVSVMRERILDINPAAQVDTIQKFFLPGENVEDFFICRYDYVVDAIDTITAKIFLVEECTRRGIKIISSMGAGNKLDATRFKVSDIFQTSVDPVAKILRKKLKERGIKNLKVVWSDEPPLPVKNFIGSAAFVPSVAGLILAGEVVKDFLSGY
ncbi:MAG: tRNA threonylcarbamoyladenosine dehydratase [Selenomonadaceae bacterium]|nr:tRNA threonylcarbamoyladenosine dehydratase [Selenomonadaceae bacterium]MBR6889324.1 tRNA threonylcarbamoyladenosine dehydratase [Selenomonadaceae bacterium]